MASSQVILKSSFLKINSNTQYYWYMYKQSHINENKSYSNNELIDKFTYTCNYKLQNPYTHGEKEYIRQIKDYIKLDQIYYENVIFVYFDSNIMCKRKLVSMLQMVNRLENQKKDKTIIIVSCLTAMRENLYKILNQDKYQLVNFDILKNNYKILSSKKSIDNNLYKTNIRTLSELEFAFDYDAMYDLYYNQNLTWHMGFRNEVNDIVQINILSHLLNYISYSKCLLFSDDINMIQKAHDSKCNFKIYTHINKQHHMGFKKINIDYQQI